MQDEVKLCYFYVTFRVAENSVPFCVLPVRIYCPYARINGGVRWDRKFATGSTWNRFNFT